MARQLTRYQIFEYSDQDPCIIYNMNIAAEGIVSSHWHKELEIVYYLRGKTLHYIDGKCIQGIPGRVIVTNCECVHNILPEERPLDDGLMDCVVILISEAFLKRYFPEYKRIYFTNEKTQAAPALADTIMKISDYQKSTDHEPQDYLYLNGLLLHLVYYLYNEGAKRQDDASVIKAHKSADRLKEVLTYIADHYAEPISQKEIAETFFFDSSHFSRLFKQCMGITFTDYLVRFRVNHAKKDLLETNDSITDIALSNGFSDSRSFINSFKKIYGKPPLQYRKSIMSK